MQRKGSTEEWKKGGIQKAGKGGPEERDDERRQDGRMGEREDEGGGGSEETRKGIHKVWMRIREALVDVLTRELRNVTYRSL